MELRSCVIFAVAALCIQFSSQMAVELESPRNETAPIIEPLNKSMADAVNKFGYKLLLTMMNQKKDDNIVISPSGIAGLLAMALLGTVGRTYDEIAETLGFSQDVFINREYHHQLGDLLQSLNSNVSSKTIYADAMFVDMQTQLREMYLTYLYDVYHGEALRTDFKQTEKAKNEINEWVSNHTEGQINDFIKHSLPTSTKIVLLSALYFKGQWALPFSPEYTAKGVFKTARHDVMVDLMLTYGKIPFAVSEKRDFTMIALPYNDSETIMYALKPKKLSLLELLEQTDYETIEATINKLSDERKCVVRFPKMELKSTVKLDNSLKAIGIHDMFTPGLANFALMVDNPLDIANKTDDESNAKLDNKIIKDMLDSQPNPGIHVDTVMHDVKISINEFGTEAVAATAAVLARTADQFYADSPFYMFIRNERTKLVTFSAVIFDPTI